MDIDAVLDPVIGKQTIKKGRNVIMKIGDAEVEYDDKFRLYLQTKLANPHFKPEVAAQTTLVNFCVTEKGLEDQLLALVRGSVVFCTTRGAVFYARGAGIPFLRCRCSKHAPTWGQGSKVRATC